MLTLQTPALPAPTGGEQKNFMPLLFAMLIFMVVGCMQETTDKQGAGKDKVTETTTLPNHVKYTFHKRNDKGRKPKEGDLVTFHLRVQNHKDVELSSNLHPEIPYEENYFIYKPFFKEVFAMASEGDSLSFWINADSLRGRQGYLETPKVPAGTPIKWTLKVIRVRSKEEIKRELKEKYAKRHTADSLAITAYIQDLKKKELRIEMQVTDSGLHYYIRKPGKGRPPQEGDTVTVNYTEKSIDGKLFSKSDAPMEFVIGYTMPKGLDEGLSLMTEGASSVFILPTKLGYEDENMTENMSKNVILVYEIDMIKMKH